MSFLYISKISTVILEMSLIWKFFTKSDGKGFCKVEGCNYSPDFPPKAPTSNLISHLKHKHPELHKHYEADKSQNPRKRKADDEAHQPQPVASSSSRSSRPRLLTASPFPLPSNDSDLELAIKQAKLVQIHLQNAQIEWQNQLLPEQIEEKRLQNQLLQEQIEEKRLQNRLLHLEILSRERERMDADATDENNFG